MVLSQGKEQLDKGKKTLEKNHNPDIWIYWLKEHQEFTMSVAQKIKLLFWRFLIIFSDTQGNFHNIIKELIFLFRK